jgi:putative membrane protein
MFWSEYCGPDFMGGPFAGYWFILIVVLAIILILSWLFVTRKKQSVESRADAALDLLRQRYASGEIDETEYVRRRENLT